MIFSQRIYFLEVCFVVERVEGVASASVKLGWWTRKAGGGRPSMMPPTDAANPLLGREVPGWTRWQIHACVLGCSAVSNSLWFWGLEPTRLLCPSMAFPRQENWSGLPFPSPGDLPDPGIESTSPAPAGGLFTAEPWGRLLQICTVGCIVRRRNWHLPPSDASSQRRYTWLSGKGIWS